MVLRFFIAMWSKTSLLRSVLPDFAEKPLDDRCWVLRRNHDGKLEGSYVPSNSDLHRKTLVNIRLLARMGLNRDLVRGSIQNGLCSLY
jgi:hypothetical protein